MSGRFRTFQIKILSRIDGIQIEIADVDDKKMLIATDLAMPVDQEAQIYHQEAFGLVPELTPLAIATTSDRLTERLMARRAALGRQPRRAVSRRMTRQELDDLRNRIWDEGAVRGYEDAIEALVDEVIAYRAALAESLDEWAQLAPDGPEKYAPERVNELREQFHLL